MKDIYARWEYPISMSVVRNKKRRVGIVAGLYAKGLFRVARLTYYVGTGDKGSQGSSDGKITGHVNAL